MSMVKNEDFKIIKGRGPDQRFINSTLKLLNTYFCSNCGIYTLIITREVQSGNDWF